MFIQLNTSNKWRITYLNLHSSQRQELFTLLTYKPCVCLVSELCKPIIYSSLKSPGNECSSNQHLTLSKHSSQQFSFFVFSLNNPLASLSLRKNSLFSIPLSFCSYQHLGGCSRCNLLSVNGLIARSQDTFRACWFTLSPKTVVNGFPARLL